jgi:class 3 adenylate cyclase
MRCPGCGFENPEGLKFCNECGAPLRMPCAQCGFMNQPQAKFCGECGAALPSLAQASAAPLLSSRPHEPRRYTPGHLGEKILHSKAALEGERKQVTVFFTDLKGSMELLVDRDPEEARQLLDPVLVHMMEAVQRFEGTVNLVMGDGIKALIGVPQAHEDDAQRAVWTGLGMVEAMGRLNAPSHDRSSTQHAQRLQVRLRIHTGLAVVGEIVGGAR